MWQSKHHQSKARQKQLIYGKTVVNVLIERQAGGQTGFLSVVSGTSPNKSCFSRQNQMQLNATTYRRQAVHEDRGRVNIQSK